MAALWCRPKVAGSISLLFGLAQVRLRAEDGAPVVRLDGRLVVLPQEKLAVLADSADP